MKNNKGFSMVELIIVIAIMAIVVGAIAPFLLKYVEKTNVSSDYQLADTIRSAVAYSIVDAKVVNDPASQPYLNNMEAGPYNIENITGTCVLRDSLKEYTGCEVTDLTSFVRSKHGSGMQCLVSTENGIVVVTFTETDGTAGKDTSSGSPANDITVR